MSSQTPRRPTVTAAAATPPEIRKLLPRVVALGVALIATFVFFFVTPGREPGPNGLPVAVAGQSAATDSLAARLESQDFKVVRVADAAAAREKIEDRDVYGAFVGEPGSQRLLVAGAASVPVAQMLQDVGRSAQVRSVQDVKPIDSDDPRGVTLNLFVLALVITSILTALMSIQLMPRLQALGPRLATFGAVAVLGALVAVGILKAQGALPGPFLAEAGVAAFAILAIATSSFGLIRLLVSLIGPTGGMAPFLILLMLGNPASGLASAPELLPTPWHPLGMFLPPGALGSALGGTAYFGGAGVVGPLLVLTGYAAVGLGLNQLASLRQARSAGVAPARPQRARTARAVTAKAETAAA
jgi:hypothetical protein